MRIAIDIRPLLEPQPSGISVYTERIVSELLAVDRQNEYHLFSNARRGLPDRYREQFQKAGGLVREWHIPNKLLNTSLLVARRPVLDRLLGGASVFFAPNINFLSVSADCPLVTTVHDLSYLYPSFYSFRVRTWHQFVRPRAILSRSARIIAVSESTKRDMCDTFGVSPEKVSVIYSGIDAERFAAVDAEGMRRVRSKYGLHRPYVLSVSTVEARKNIDGLVKAWILLRQKQHLEADLVVVGRQADSRLVRSHDGVIFLGYVREAEKPYLYQGAHVFCYPSFYEGFGLPMLEAMAAGVPVVAGHGTSMPEVAGAAALLVNPYNLEELAAAVRQLFEDTSLRQSFIARGKALARSFTWRRTAVETLRALTSAANSPVKRQLT